jgi:SAM-dependent methyltransferase
VSGVGSGDRLYDDPAMVHFYDLENGWGPDLESCAGLAEEVLSILDLGCGTGVFLARMASTCNAVGVDPAAAMLEIARNRPGGAGVNWIHADARGLDLGRRFGLVVLTGHAFQVFLTEADQRAVLATIARHLAPHGRFVFDSRNPAVEEWREWMPGISRRTLRHPDLGQVEAWNDAAHDPMTGIVTYRTFYRIAATGRILSAASRLRFTPRARLSELLDEAGLAVEDWLGGWDGRPCTPDAPEIIPIGRLK